MVLDPAKTVREVAVAFPQAPRVFEKTKIDYCCRGDQLLGDACAKAGVDLLVLEQMLEANAATTVSGLDCGQLSVAQLIKYILDTHHVYTRDEMQRLEGLVESTVHAHGANHPELLSMRNLLQQLFAELKGHMFKEERILFPFVIQLEESRSQHRPAPFAPFGTVYNPVRMMIVEHDNAGDLLRELRKLSRGYRVPDDACASYQEFYKALEAFEQDLHQDIHLENNNLFPKAIALEGDL